MDTGTWVALRNAHDDLHKHAASHYEHLRAERVSLVTTSFVIDEVATRLRYDVGLENAFAFRDMVGTAEAGRLLRVVWIDRALVRQAWSLLEQYGDVPFSFTDATTIAVARSRKIREVFAFDDDFEAAGLTVVPAGS